MGNVNWTASYRNTRVDIISGYVWLLMIPKAKIGWKTYIVGASYHKNIIIKRCCKYLKEDGCFITVLSILGVLIMCNFHPSRFLRNIQSKDNTYVFCYLFLVNIIYLPPSQMYHASFQCLAFGSAARESKTIKTSCYLLFQSYEFHLMKYPL